MTETFPLVSVIIPFYNSENYLRETILSVKNQTYPNIEIIIVDDGSTDNSYNIAQEFSSSNCKVIKQGNRGACSARNNGIKKCNGEYLQFLDADDVLSEDKIYKQVEQLLTETDKTIATCGWYYFEENISNKKEAQLEIFKSYERPLDLLTDMWVKQEYLSSACYIFHRSIINDAGNWNEEITNNQDGEFFCRILLHCDHVTFCKGIAYYRTNLQGSVSRGIKTYKNANSRLKTYLLYEQHVADYLQIGEVRKALSVNFYYFIYIYYENFPDLVKIAIEKTKELGVPPPTNFGGRNFRKMSKVFGFFQVLKARKFIKNKLGKGRVVHSQS